MTRSNKTDHLQIRLAPGDKARLRRLAERAGTDVSAYVLERILPTPRLEFERLVDRAKGAERSYALAQLHDFLAALTRKDFTSAVESDPFSRRDGAFLTNYVAAMVEHVAVVLGVRAPEWTRRLPPLDEPWFATDLASLRLHLLLNAPAAFRARNLFVDSAVGERV